MTLTNQIERSIGLKVRHVEGVSDEQMRFYCRGLCDGMRGERMNSVMYLAERSRNDARILHQVDVLLELSDGEHELTFEEFNAWIDGAELATCKGQLQP